MSARNTATENLARWLEIHLKPYAMQHEAYIRDTKLFLLHLEHLNEMRAPFREGTKLISWDIVNYYTNCNTQMCIEAVRMVLEPAQSREFLEVPVERILEALKITMTSNNGEFLKRHFTQINGATIGRPASTSLMDSVHRPSGKGGGSPYSRRLEMVSDDTWDIEENVNEKDLVQFTEYMSAKVLKDRIKFKLEHSETELVFLDTKVHLKNGFLIPEIYSKPTDSHEYLNPKSSHPPNVVKNIPYSVALRVRRNCFDQIEDDTLFKKNMINYKAYLLNSGYEARHIDRSFIKVAKMKRNTTLRPKKAMCNQGAKKLNFVTTFDPSFPDIAKVIRKFSNILSDDEECEKVFPEGSFRVVYRRGHKNLKELLAPSGINDIY